MSGHFIFENLETGTQYAYAPEDAAYYIGWDITDVASACESASVLGVAHLGAYEIRPASAEALS